MRGDETRRGVAPNAESREVKGPRHAAPRKSLLTKFQIPVGKTMALAAMPTAVFVGMGMAPKLALADEKDIPFAPGPCVTQSDEPAESASPSPSKSPSPSASTSPTATPSPGASVAPKPGTTPSAPKPESKPAEESKAARQSSPAATPSTGASASPSASKTPNPLDPLGVGDKVKEFFDELGRPLKDAQKPDTPAPSTSTAPTPDPSADAIREAAKTAGAKVEELPQDVKDTTAKPKDETGRATDKATDKDKAAKDEAEKEKKDEDEDEDKTSPSPSPSASASKDANGKKPFPCPTLDAKALADAKLEPGIPLLPDQPWYLDSSLLTLYGLDYHGIVEVKTGSGKIKKVLKFTADSLDIKDLYQTVGKEGNVAHLKSRPGSTSKIRGGTVTMYTESLKGNLFGLIPIEFTPNSPPPLNVPFAFFTDVKVVQAGQFGGTLTVPGLKNYIGPPE
ncbi:hypothetical protein [Streptomyces sp. NPDC058701]|uniref:hypothetical protein n=1 Tax=Streptomyces sp. NPDC058701 TaxID=3346608 RepID=UPI00366239E4